MPRRNARVIGVGAPVPIAEDEQLDLSEPITRLLNAVNDAFRGLRGWKRIPPEFAYRVQPTTMELPRLYAEVIPADWDGIIICRFDNYRDDAGWRLITAQFLSTPIRVDGYPLEGFSFEVSDAPDMRVPCLAPVRLMHECLAEIVHWNRLNPAGRKRRHLRLVVH